MLVVPEKAKELYNDQFRKDIIDAEYAQEVEDGILQMCQDLSDGLLQLRIHPSKNLHASFISVFRSHTLLTLRDGL